MTVTLDHNRNGGPGKVRILENSGLRKLMRAARRGKVPEERIGICMRAMQSAADRQEVFDNSRAGARANLGPGLRYDMRRPDTRVAA